MSAIRRWAAPATTKRKRFDLAFEAAGLKETRRAFYRALAELGLGREAVVIAVKADERAGLSSSSPAAVPAPPCCTRRCRRVPGVEMHHEYMVQITQPLAVQALSGPDRRGRMPRGCSRETHGAAIHYSEAAHWGDSSNKLSWLIPDLAALFPEARFVHLVRDGRKVASSYFHKLGDECYDDRSTAHSAGASRRSRSNPAPPPEKKYWWPLPAPRTAATPPASAASASSSASAGIGRRSTGWCWRNWPRCRRSAALFVRLEDLRASRRPRSRALYRLS